MATSIPMEDTFNSTSLDVDLQRTLNYYPQSKMGWRQFPGAAVFTDFSSQSEALDASDGALIDSVGSAILVAAEASGDDRGILENGPGGLTYVVMGASLFSISSTGVSVFLGTIAGTVPCGMDSNGTQLMIVNGTTSYVYTVAAGLLATGNALIDDSFTVTFQDLKFIYDLPNGEFVMSSTNDGTTTSNDDRAFAEWDADTLEAVESVNQFIYLQGAISTEAWFFSGVGRPPVDRQKTFEYGVAGKYAKDTIDDVLYFIDHNHRPAKFTGLQYESLYSPALGEEWKKYSVTSFANARVNAYALHQENFIDFVFPDDSKTWTYHERTGRWFERTFLTTSVVDAYNEILAVGATTKKVYKLDFDEFKNDGSDFTRTKDLPLISSELFGDAGMNMIISNLVMTFVTSGSASISVSYSKDRSTFSTPRTFTVNGNVRKELTNFGKCREIIFRITTTANAKVEFISAGVNAIILEG